MDERLNKIPEAIAGTGGDSQTVKELDILRFWCTKPTGSNMPLQTLLQLEKELRPEHFQFFGDVAQAILAVDKSNAGEVTKPLLQEEIEKAGTEIPSGYIIEDFFDRKDLPSDSTISGYAKSLINTHKKRNLIDLARQMNNKANDPNTSPEEIYTFMQSNINDPGLISQVSSAKYPLMSEYLDEYFEQLEENPPDILGIQTHTKKLDEITGGLYGLVILGGMPNRGKSTLAFQFGERAVLNALHDNSQKVGFIMFSFEMPSRHFIDLLVSRYGKVEIKSLKRHKRDKTLISSISRAKPTVEKVAPYIKIIGTGQGSLNLENILLQSQIFKNETGVSKLYIAIDHLQICPTLSTFHSADSRAKINNVVETLTMYYHNLAGSDPYSVCMLAISQLNRAGYGTIGMASFRESQAIEASADILLMLSPEAVINAKKDKGEKYEEWVDEYTMRDIEEGERMNLYVVKNRYGEKGKYIPLKFRKRDLFFEEEGEIINEKSRYTDPKDVDYLNRGYK